LKDKKCLKVKFAPCDAKNQRMSEQPNERAERVMQIEIFIKISTSARRTTVLRFLRNKMKQNKRKRLFSLREGFAVGVGFFGYFFATKKVINQNFRRKPLKILQTH